MGRLVNGMILALAFSAVGPAAAAGVPVAVVELFTSQGCSSCPPANANLVTLSQRPDLLTLSFSVTYWDRLGWKDTFGKPEFTERQVIYEPALGQRGPFTPQIIVNGAHTVVGNQLAEVDALIDRAAVLTGPSIDLGTAKVSIGSGTAPADGADVWQVTYEPAPIDVPVGRGENTGRTLKHASVVRGLDNLGVWNGSRLDLPVAPAPNGLRTAILVQARNGGPILAAITN